MCTDDEQSKYWLYVDGLTREDGGWRVAYTHSRGGQPGKHVFPDFAAFRALATAKNGIEVDPSILDDLEIKWHRGWLPHDAEGNVPPRLYYTADQLLRAGFGEFGFNPTMFEAPPSEPS